MKKPSVLYPLDYMKRLLDRRHIGIRVDSNPPVSLSPEEVEIGDVLFCRGDGSQLPWRVIARGSSGPYVHVALYSGEGKVTESIPGGVQEFDLQRFIQRYRYVAVTRSSGYMNTPGRQSALMAFCARHVENRTQYSRLAAGLSPMFEFGELLKLRLTLNSPTRKQPRLRSKTFCSQFVVDAFIDCGYIPPDFVGNGARSPTSLAEDYFFELVGYLSAAPLTESELEKDIFWTGGG